MFGAAAAPKAGALVPPDCAWIHSELKRHRHVTLQLLWEEYRERYGGSGLPAQRLLPDLPALGEAAEALDAPAALRRREALRRLRRAHRTDLRQRTGRRRSGAQLFVSALGASGYAYAEATRTQSLPDWLASHVRALEFYGAAPTIFVPDNPKVGVTRADRYEPELQRSYEELAAHYRAVVIPARPYRPKDKSRAELTVLLVCRWILARLRHQRFFSLEELNAAIRPLLLELNERPFQRLPGSRRSVFEALDRPAMRALPPTPYVYAEWKERTVAFDYHVDVDRHYYSVPHALVGHSVWARYTAATVEVFFRSARVATHIRSYQRGAHTTVPEHMPKSHRAHAEWSPKRLIQWGESIGAHTGAIVEHLLRSKPHPGARLSGLPGAPGARPAVRRGAPGGRQRARRALR